MFVFVLYFWLFSVFCSLTFYILIVTLNNTKANSCMWQSNLPVSDWFIEGVILKCGIPSSHFYHMPPSTPAGCQFVVANIANASCRLVYTMCCWLYKLRKRSIVLQWRRSHEVQFSLLKNPFLNISEKCFSLVMALVKAQSASKYLQYDIIYYN